MEENMGELVSLAQWKHDREMEEIRDLRRRLETAAAELGPDPEPMPYYPEAYHAVPDAGRMNEISFKIGEILRDVIYDVMRIDKVEEEKDNE
jgi:hypothetical protein